MKRKIGLAALLAAMILLLAACGSSIEGSWQFTGGSGEAALAFNVVREIGGTVTFTFRDGKLTISGNGGGDAAPIEGTYVMNGEKMTITIGNASTRYEIKLDGKKLTLTQPEDGSILNFDKK